MKKNWNMRVEIYHELDDPSNPAKGTSFKITEAFDREEAGETEEEAVEEMAKKIKFLILKRYKIKILTPINSKGGSQNGNS